MDINKPSNGLCTFVRPCYSQICRHIEWTVSATEYIKFSSAWITTVYPDHWVRDRYKMTVY